MNRVGLDSLPPVTEDEALELCAHHLQLAAIYAMNVSDDIGLVLSEAKRLIRPQYEGDPVWAAVQSFLISSQKAHDAIKVHFEAQQDKVTERFDETIKDYMANGPLAQARALLGAATKRLEEIDDQVPGKPWTKVKSDIDTWLAENPA